MIVDTASGSNWSSPTGRNAIEPQLDSSADVTFVELEELSAADSLVDPNSTLLGSATCDDEQPDKTIAAAITVAVIALFIAPSYGRFRQNYMA